ncbi:MAG: TonB-dependent receptor [Emcibacter sp.]|nr:TonB-dependent receptor [Emcibacter sp.]
MKNIGKKTKLTTFAAAFMLSTSVLALSNAVYAGDQTSRVNINSKPLADALIDIARQMDVTITATGGLTEGKFSSGLQGRMTVDEALDDLLYNTNLYFRLNEDGSYAIVKKSGFQKVGFTTTEEYESELGVYEDDERADEVFTRQLEEVVVTAQKRAESIQDVPLSILAVSGENLRNAGINTPLELEKVVSSLQVSKAFVAAGPTIRIRGFGTAGSAATDSEVAIYLDSVVIPRPGAIISAFLDVKSVEVLNGPQGTLFGRNAALGAISISTNEPSMRETSLDLTMEAGRFGTQSGTVVANIPVSDTFAFRVALKANHTNGEFSNLLDSTTYGKNTTLVGRISAKWDVSPDITWVVRADGTDTDGDGVSPSIVYVNSASPAQLAAVNSFVVGNGGTPLVFNEDPSYTVNLNLAGAFNRGDQYGVSSDLNWDVSPILSMRLINSYRRWRNHQVTQDLGANSLDLIRSELTHSSASQSHEIQLISDRDAFMDGKMGFTAGLYYFHEKYALTNQFNLGTQFCSVIFGPTAPFLVAPCQAGPQYNAGNTPFEQVTNSYAGYVQFNYQILPTLDLDLGARLTSDKKTGSIQQIVNNPIATFLSMTVEGPEDLSFRTGTKPSVRASLSWHASDEIMLFATYATGSKSGGFNSSPSPLNLGADARTFETETVKDIEIGVKSSFWDRKATLNITLFNTALSDYQDITYDGTAFVTRNSGNVRSRGFDADGRLFPLPDVTLSFGVTFLDSIYTSNLTAPGLEGCLGSPACPRVQDLTGERLQYAPRWKGNVGFEWTHELDGGYRITVAGRENFSGGFLTANTNNPQSWLPGFVTTDLRVSFQSPDETWQLDIFGTNIFDKHHLSLVHAQPLGIAMGVNDPVTGATLFRGYLSDPARYGVRVSAKF